MNRIAFALAITAAFGLAGAASATSPGGGPHVRVFNGQSGPAAANRLPAVQNSRRGYGGPDSLGYGGPNAHGLLLPAVQSAREAARRSSSGQPYVTGRLYNGADSSHPGLQGYPGFQGGVRVGAGDINDGTSNTMMIGESRNYPGGLPRGTNIMMGDGSVHDGGVMHTDSWETPSN